MEHGIHTYVRKNTVRSNVHGMWQGTSFLEEPECKQSLDGPKSVGMKERRTFWASGTTPQRAGGGDPVVCFPETEGR